MKTGCDKYPESRGVEMTFFAVALNILLAFIIYSVARVEFLLENISFFRQAIEEGRIFGLLVAGPVFDAPGIFYTNALYILLMLFPCHLKEKEGWYKMCKWLFIVVNSIALAANLADSVYFSYTLRRTAWSIFGEFGNETNFGKIILTETLRHWYLIVLFIVLVAGMWKLYVSPAYSSDKHNLVGYYVISAIALIIAGITTAAAIRGGLLNHWYNYLLAIPLVYIAYRTLRGRGGRMVKIAGGLCGVAAITLLCTAPIGGWRHRDIRPIAISNANAYTKSAVETSLVLNTPFTMIRSIGNVPFSDPGYFADKSQLDAIYSPVHNPEVSVGMNRKNIVILIIESFGKEYIGSLNKDILGKDYKGYTPFTDSLLDYSAYWRYSYDNGQKSIDGMPSILAGIPMFVRPFIVTPQAVNTLKGLPGLLADEGYSTAFFHGARTGSMGFDGFARSIGFEKYYGREDFYSDSRFGGEKEFDGYWAVWDEPFLQYYAAKMTEMKQPFLTAVFTASNHHPFHIPEKYKGKFPEGEMIIHPTVGYTDYALRCFFETARRQPWFENTIFVITNDHTNMRAHDEYRSDIGAFYGPIIIYDPSGEIKPGEREGIAQQTDIMPTVLSILNYGKSYVAFGLDLLQTEPEDTWAVNYTNNIYQFVSNGYILQFDGNRTIGVYDINDHKMQTNLIGKIPSQSAMETKLKAIIQSYMDRMLNDDLTVR